MAGNRILCSCWSSGTFQVYNITLPPVVQLELCTLQCKPSTFYNNKEKFNYTFISLFNKTCLVENQDHERQLPPCDQPYPPPLKLYECFPSPVLFTSYLPLCYSLYSCSPCYLHQITPPPPMRYTSHFLICYFLHIFPLYCLLNYFPLLIYLMCVVSAIS